MNADAWMDGRSEAEKADGAPARDEVQTKNPGTYATCDMTVSVPTSNVHRADLAMRSKR